MVLPMAKHNHHIIKQQIVELDVPPAVDVHKLSQAVAQRLHTHTMVDVETLFDRYVSAQHTLNLERVEINLGRLNSTNWQAQFESRLVTQLTEVLEQAMIQNNGQPSTEDHGRDDFEQVLYFLRQGRLPSRTESPPANWPLQWVHELDSSQWQSLRTTLTRNDHARSRLTHTLDDKTLVIVVENLFGLRKVLQLLTLCFPASLPHAQQLIWRRLFWQALLDPVPVSIVDEYQRGIVFMRRLLQLQTSFNTPLASTREASAITPELPAPWRGWLTAIQDNAENTTSNSLPADNKPIADNETSGAPLSPIPMSATTTEQRKPSQRHLTPAARDDNIEPSISPLHPRSDSAVSRQDTNRIDVGETIPVTGAGGIILHPFLEELFRTTELLDGHQFRDEACRARAVHLLSLLTFGNETMPEYALLMPKFLCGMAWQEALPPLELMDRERASCDELLQAVLGHWQALKSGSAAWLREQFFLRPARLEQLDPDWRLTVEARAQDVLLNRLPWGLGVIDLPWRHGRIYVHWLN